ncbi:MAG: sugar transferase [Acidobacteria bacterium]|nr:sugar transferase [Acidobacteriota bacterium]
MATFDYLKQSTLSGQRRHHERMAGSSRLFSRPSVAISIWAGMDFVSALLAGFIAVRIRLTPVPQAAADPLLRHLEAAAPLTSMIYLVVFSIYVVIFARIYGLYRSQDVRSGLNEQRLTIQTTLTAGLMLCGTLYVMKEYAVSRIMVALTIVITLLFLMVRRAIERKMMQRRFLQGRETRNVLIVGNGRVAHALRNHLQALPHMGFRFMGFVSLDNHSESVADPQVIGDIRNCVALARSLFVDEIYFSTPADKKTVIGVVEEARDFGIDVRVVPDLYDGLAWNAPVEFIGQFPTIPLHQRDFPRGAFLIKRVLDVILSMLALIVTAPIMMVIAFMVRMDSPGPIFYRASRIGRKGRTFTCYKFRTMVANADKLQDNLAHKNERDGILFKITDDPRITRVGRRLRKYSLDELPQFYNVLTGDMSLVGPRPPLASEVEKYDLAHLRRLDVLPGITGLWQVEARQDPSFDSYISLDTAYVENWNLMLDIRILARTVGVVLGGTGS